MTDRTAQECYEWGRKQPWWTCYYDIREDKFLVTAWGGIMMTYADASALADLCTIRKGTFKGILVPLKERYANWPSTVLWHPRENRFIKSLHWRGMTDAQTEQLLNLMNEQHR